MKPKTPPPVFRWERCYQIGEQIHWALCDTHSDQESEPMVSCGYMVLQDSCAVGNDGRPVPEQPLPALIVKLLNKHYAKTL